MSEANAIFILDGKDLTIKCTMDDKMEDICKNYSTKINTNVDSLLFLYEGNEINYRLSFKEQANSVDRNNHKIKIYVYKIEDNIMICPECGEKIDLNYEKLDEIILYNDKIKHSLNIIKSQIDNIIDTSSNNSLKIKLKNIKNLLYIISENNKKTNEKIKNLFNDFIPTKKLIRIIR